MSDLDRASDLIRQSRHADALEVLSGLEANPFVRRLRLECLEGLERFDELLKDYAPPSSISEACAVLTAAWVLRRSDLLRAVLDSPIVRDTEDPALRELSEKYTRLLASLSKDGAP